MKNIDFKKVCLSIMFLSLPLSASQEMLGLAALETLSDCAISQILYGHICNHKIDEAIELINQNPGSLNVPDKKRRLPINWICSSMGNEKLLQDLITQKPDQKSMRNPMGLLPLHYAAFVGNIQNIQLLLDSGVRLDDKSNTGATAFHATCATGQLDAANFFFNQNCTILHEKDNYGRTALHFACMSGQIDIAKFLLCKDPAIIHEKDKYGITALQIAVKFKQKEMVDVLIKRPSCQSSEIATDISLQERIRILLGQSKDPSTPLNIAGQKRSAQEIE